MIKPELPLLLIGCLAATKVWAQADSFVGDWKLNPSKSTFIDQMKVESFGGNIYAFDFGGGAEKITVDGTDQPGASGTLLSVKIESADTWQVVRKKDGRTLLTAHWKLSPDGDSLSDNYTEFGPDGSPSTVNYRYRRTTPGSGFVGTWNSPMPIQSASVLQIKPYETQGLSLIQPARQLIRNLNFDGKDYPMLGSGAPHDSTAAARRLDARTLEITAKVKGNITRTEQLQLSPDLRTLTSTIHPVGQRDPNIFVYERQ